MVQQSAALYVQGKYDEAIKAYDEAIRLDPNDADAWNNKGLVLEYFGRTAEANTAFAKAKELGYTSRSLPHQRKLYGPTDRDCGGLEPGNLLSKSISDYMCSQELLPGLRALRAEEEEIRIMEGTRA